MNSSERDTLIETVLESINMHYRKLHEIEEELREIQKQKDDIVIATQRDI